MDNPVEHWRAYRALQLIGRLERCLERSKATIHISRDGSLEAFGSWEIPTGADGENEPKYARARGETVAMAIDSFLMQAGIDYLPTDLLMQNERRFTDGE